MTWRRRMRRRLLWSAVLLGLLVLLCAVSILRVGSWARDGLRGNSELRPDAFAH